MCNSVEIDRLEGELSRSHRSGDEQKTELTQRLQQQESAFKLQITRLQNELFEEKKAGEKLRAELAEASENDHTAVRIVSLSLSLSTLSLRL